MKEISSIIDEQMKNNGKESILRNPVLLTLMKEILSNKNATTKYLNSSSEIFSVSFSLLISCELFENIIIFELIEEELSNNERYYLIYIVITIFLVDI